MRRRQQGVALISVLLVMSLALLIVSGLLRSNRQLLQGAGQQLHQVSLRQQAVAAETWAMQVLEQAALADQRTVDLTQAWAHAQPELSGADAAIQVSIEDLAGRLNLNALLVPGQVDPVTLKRWERLQRLLGLEPLQLQQLGVLKELSQLRLLPGIDARTLRLLEPWVALLPPQAALNINTAPVLVLRTLGGVNAALAESLASQRSTHAWPSVEAFSRDPLLGTTLPATHGLGVTSHWYRINVRVTQGRTTFRSACDVELNPKTRRFTVLQRYALPLTVTEAAP